MPAVQLTGALDGPMPLYLPSDELSDAVDEAGTRIGHAATSACTCFSLVPSNDRTVSKSCR